MTLMYGYLIGHWVTLHGLIVMVGLAFYVTSSHTLHLRRHPSAAIAWVVALVLLPYVALPLYLMFGSRKVKSYRPAAKRYEFTKSTFNPDTLMARTQQLAAIMALPAASPYQNLNITKMVGKHCKSCET